MAGIAAGSSVLVVCTGNICRSPFGASFLRQRAAERSIDLGVRSAGTHAVAGSRATYEACEVATELGVDLSDHRARPVTEDLLATSDVVVALEEVHVHFLEPLLERIEGAAPDFHVLGIGDPFGSDLDAYRGCFERIAAGLEALL